MPSVSQNARPNARPSTRPSVYSVVAAQQDELMACAPAIYAMSNDPTASLNQADRNREDIAKMAECRRKLLDAYIEYNTTVRDFLVNYPR